MNKEDKILEYVGRFASNYKNYSTLPHEKVKTDAWLHTFLETQNLTPEKKTEFIKQYNKLKVE